MTKEDFKNFVRNKPELASYVTNGDRTWQKFYELYDIYGEDESIWNKYTKKTNTSSKVTDLLNKFNEYSLNILLGSGMLNFSLSS
jgi:hypothetical protein